MYQYSLDAFNTFLQKAIDRTQAPGRRARAHPELRARP